ncbi:MAG: extracellular solute-binding protein [Firmicutes bacterium]|nr:extracellular solute-binding protein [Bacillota bacterium]
MVGKRLLVLSLCALLSAVAVFPAAAQTVELTLWHHWTAHRSEYVQQLLDAFMAEHPNIKVQHQVAPTGGAQDRLTTMILSGAAPELVMVSSGYAFPFMIQGGFYPLDEFIARDGIDLGMFIPADIAGFQLFGETYALPVTSGAAWTNLLFYNRDMLADVGLADTGPEDWEQWREAALRMTRVADDGTLLAAGSNIPSMMQAVAWTGSVPWSDDWRTAQVNTPQMQSTVSFLLDMLEDMYGTYSVHNNFLVSAVTRFQNQELGLWFINNSAFGFANAFNFRWGARLAPVNRNYADAKPIGFASGTWAYAIPATIDPNKLEAAGTLLKWLTTQEETGGWFTRVQSRPSPVIAFNTHPDYRLNNPYWDVVIHAAAHDIIAPPGVGEALGAVHTRIMNGTVQPHQGLDDAQRAVQQALDDYWAAVGQ